MQLKIPNAFEVRPVLMSTWVENSRCRSNIIAVNIKTYCSVGVGVFVTGLSQISSFFSYVTTFIQFLLINWFFDSSIVNQIEKVPRDIRGEKSRKDIASSGKLV